MRYSLERTHGIVRCEGASSYCADKLLALKICSKIFRRIFEVYI